VPEPLELLPEYRDLVGHVEPPLIGRFQEVLDPTLEVDDVLFEF
jgi:hypothetical protein